MSRQRGYIYALIGALSYSVLAIFGKYALQAGATPEGITFWQYAFTFAILLAYFLITDRSKLRTEPVMLLKFATIGILGGMMTNFFYYHALNHLNAGIATMLLFSSPIIINLFFVISGIRKIKLLFFLPLLMGLAGNFLSLNLLAEKHLQMSGIGILFGLLAAVFFAFYVVFMDLKVRDQNAHHLNMFASFFAMIASGLYTIMTKPSAMLPPSSSFLWLILTAIFSGVIGVYFSYHSLQIIGSDKSSIISTMELPFTLVIAFFILNERLSAVQLIGMSLVTGAIVVMRLIESKQPSPALQTVRSVREKS